MPWFRFLKRTEERASGEAPAPDEPQPVEPEAPPTSAPAGEESEVERPKRRRGSRGGRGRSKRPAAATGESEATEEGSATAVATLAPPEPARKPAATRQQAAKPRRSTQGRRRVPAKRAPLPPAKRELLITVDAGEKRVAMLENDRVAEVYVERPDRRSIAGNIYKGSVDNVLPGMEAAFVEIGLEKNGFLYVDEIVTPELEGRRHGRKIQDLLSRGQHVLVQAVKDPMKTKGARLTTEISLPGRFVVYVPQGEGLGVSRRLDDDERVRLRDILKALAPPRGGVIIRTAAEGASAEDIERDLDFLQRLWKTIEARAKEVDAPALVYQEAELPLRVVRDLFTGDFERVVVDHDRTHKRIIGYLKKTSPHMAERVVRYREKPLLFESFGVDAEIRSTLSRRVELPSGGSLVFDYAEAFTVVDVNTGRFVGSRSRTSESRLEDTITKNNLEAVKEVVRQLRLRDIGGIIVIDFIDMANPKNRAAVEEALRTELERDRTKTYVVEISPLGLVEMTRQNVTDGPREILTKKCPTCGGDGIVLSEASAAADIERRLRTLAVSRLRTKAFRVELNARVAALVIGAGAARLTEIEAVTRRRFFLEGVEDVHLDHFAVLEEGTVEKFAPEAPRFDEGQEVEVKLGEVGLHDLTAGVGKLDGHTVTVAGAANAVGKKVKARVERVLGGTVYATLVDQGAAVQAPITAEAEAERPTRKLRGKVQPALDGAAPEGADAGVALDDEDAELEPAEDLASADDEASTEAAEGDDEGEPKKKKTRRGSRGGRGRKRRPASVEAMNGGEPGVSGESGEDVDEPVSFEEDEPSPDGEEAFVVTAEDAPAERQPMARIHVPSLDLGQEEEGGSSEAADREPGENGEGPQKKRTRRGTRGGRNRRKRTPEIAEADGFGGSSPDAIAVAAVTLEPPEEAAAAEAKPEPAWDETERPDEVDAAVEASAAAGEAELAPVRGWSEPPEEQIVLVEVPAETEGEEPEREAPPRSVAPAPRRRAWADPPVAAAADEASPVEVDVTPPAPGAEEPGANAEPDRSWADDEDVWVEPPAQANVGSDT